MLGCESLVLITCWIVGYYYPGLIIDYSRMIAREAGKSLRECEEIFYVALLLVFLINVVEPEKNITAFIVAIAVSVVVVFLYLLVSIFFIKDYWKFVKTEVQRLLGKNV